MNSHKPPISAMLFLFCITSLNPTRALSQATQHDAAISWKVPIECGTANDITQRMERILAEQSNVDPDRKVVGEIIATHQQWRVQMEVTDQTDRTWRSVTVNTCYAALELSALLTALAVDPMGVMQSEDPALQARIEQLDDLSDTTTETAPDKAETPPMSKPASPLPGTSDNRSVPPTNTGPAKAMPPHPPIKKNESLPPRRYHFDIGGGLAVDMGTVGYIRPGFAVFGAVHRKKWVLGISARYLPPATFPVEHASEDAEWTSRLMAGTLSGGQSFFMKRLTLGWSIGITGMGIHAEAAEIRQPRSSTVRIGAATLSGQLSWRLSDHAGLWMEPSVHVLFARPRFFIEGIGVVYRPDRFVMGGAMGLFFTRLNGKRRNRPLSQ